MVEFVKIFMYTVAAQSSVRPQLRVIRQVINDIAMTLLQEGEDPKGEVGSTTPIADHSSFSHSLNIPPSHPLTHSPLLLSWFTQVSVVQHLSPACRAARMSEISDLPAAAILRRVNDHHVQRCRVERNR